MIAQEKISTKVEKEEHFGVKGLEVKDWVQWAKNMQAGRREGCGQSGELLEN